MTHYETAILTSGMLIGMGVTFFFWTGTFRNKIGFGITMIILALISWKEIFYPN